jgi:hypothetical protein
MAQGGSLAGQAPSSGAFRLLGSARLKEGSHGPSGRNLEGLPKINSLHAHRFAGNQSGNDGIIGGNFSTVEQAVPFGNFSIYYLALPLRHGEADAQWSAIRVTGFAPGGGKWSLNFEDSVQADQTFVTLRITNTNPSRA